MYLKATWFLFFCKSKWLLTSLAQSRIVLDYRLNDPEIVYGSCTRKWLLAFWVSERRAAVTCKRRVEPKVGGENFPYLKRLGDSKVKLFFSPESAGIAQQFCIESPTPNFNQLTFGFFSPSLYPSYCFIFLLFFLLSPLFLSFHFFGFNSARRISVDSKSLHFLTGTLLSVSSPYTVRLYSRFPHLSHPHPVQLKFKRTPGIRESYLGVCGLCCG